MFKKLSILSISFGFLFSSLLIAQEIDVTSEIDVGSPTSSSSLFIEDVKPAEVGDIYNPKGFWPLLSVGAGYMGRTDDIRTEGVPVHLRFMGSYYFEGPWVSEVGGGLYNEVFFQKGGGADTLQALELEAAVRYQLRDRWSVGPVWTTLTGNNRYESNTKNWTSFLGVQLKRDIAWDNQYLVRMGGRFMTDIGVSGEQINAAMFEVEVGLGEGGSAPIAEVEPFQFEDRSVGGHLADRAMNNPLMFDGPMNFKVNEPTMISTASDRADRLAKVLANNAHLFQRIEVIGHADERGPDSYNQKLSERRAEYVAHKFRRAGLSSELISAEGKGSSEPVAFNQSETSWFKNRRVEVKLIGVKDPVAMRSLLRSIH